MIQKSVGCLRRDTLARRESDGLVAPGFRCLVTTSPVVGHLGITRSERSDDREPKVSASVPRQERQSTIDVHWLIELDYKTPVGKYAEHAVEASCTHVPETGARESLIMPILIHDDEEKATWGILRQPVSVEVYVQIVHLPITLEFEPETLNAFAPVVLGDVIAPN